MSLSSHLLGLVFFLYLPSIERQIGIFYHSVAQQFIDGQYLPIFTELMPSCQKIDVEDHPARWVVLWSSQDQQSLLTN